MWIGAVAAGAVITPMAVGYWFHDELHLNGHLAFIAQLQNGWYPPRHMTFPAFELRYHYGLDVVAAAIGAITRLPTDQALDLVTILCWAWTFCLAWQAGEAWLGRNSGLFTALAVAFGGGWSSVCAPASPLDPSVLLGLCAIEGVAISPPFISYFFQHPWSLGTPLALSAALVASQTRHCGSAIVLGVLLFALSLSQFILFLTVTAALIGAEILARRRRRALALAAVATAVLVCARSLGGFFAPMPDQQPMGLEVQLGLVPTLWGTLRWHFATFGFLLPLGVVGLGLTIRRRGFLALLAVGSLVVLNGVRYSRSWDMVKFGTVGALALSILAAGVIARLWSTRCPLRGRLFALILLAATIAPGLLYPVLLTLKPRGTPFALFPNRAPRLQPADAEAVHWLRSRIAPTDVVYRSWPTTFGYAVWGGLPQVWLDSVTPAFGFAPVRMTARQHLLANPSESFESYRAQGIRWFVLGPEDRKLKEITSRWIAARSARAVLDLGPLRIVELTHRRD